MKRSGLARFVAVWLLVGVALLSGCSTIQVARGGPGQKLDRGESLIRRRYVDGTWGQVHVTEAGTGVPLVLLHQSPLSGAMFLLRFLDPSSFIAISVLFLSVVDVTNAAGIPPLVLMAPLLIASVPFWMSYQNFWIAMGEGLTSNLAFSPSQRLRLANGYAVLMLITAAMAVGYWKWMGVLK